MKPLRLRVLCVKGPRPSYILAPLPCNGCGLFHSHAPGCGLDMSVAAMHKFTPPGVPPKEVLP